MSKPIVITLYHADWCKHCRDFMPIWETMKTNEKAKRNIGYIEYESEEIKELPEKMRKVDGKEIEGFPTIKITIDGKEYNYMDKRDADTIYRFIRKTLNDVLYNNVTQTSNTTDSVNLTPETPKKQTGGDCDSCGSCGSTGNGVGGCGSCGSIGGCGCGTDRYVDRLGSELLNYDMSKFNYATASELIDF